MSDCCSTHIKNKKWFQNKTVIVSVIICALIVLSYSVPLLVPFRENLMMYIHEVWWAVVLGLFISGLIDYYVPQEYVSHILANRKKRTILYSVGLGFMMSACNHGILAIAMQLYEKGASVSAVVAFLLASPWANMAFTILLIGLFGLQKALFIIMVSIIIALVTGYIYQALEHFSMVEHNDSSLTLEDNFSIKEDFKIRRNAYQFSLNQLKLDVVGVYKGAVSLSDMILWWLLIGVILAAAIGAYVPAEIFRQYLGPNTLGLVITLIFATVIEVCSEGSAPIAFEIFRQTGALGNAFVFLMAGVATDYTEIGLIWANIGRKSALWLPVITVPQIILWGIVANIIF